MTGGPTMRQKHLRTLFLLGTAVLSSLLFGAGPGLAEEREGDRGTIQLLTTVPVPGHLVAFDISWVDPDTQRYYLADRSNNAIDVIDAKRDLFLKQINKGGFKGFTGNNDTSGPNGVVVSGHWLFVTDAPSRVVSIDLDTKQTVADLNTGGVNRADELAF